MVRRNLKVSEIETELEKLNNIDAFDSEGSDESGSGSSGSEFDVGLASNMDDTDDEALEEVEVHPRGRVEVPPAPPSTTQTRPGRKRRRTDLGGGDSLPDIETPAQHENNSTDTQATQQVAGSRKTQTCTQFAIGPVLSSPDGLKWTVINPTGVAGRISRQNVFQDKEGPSAHAKRYVNSTSVVSSWRLLVDDRILKHIQKCTEAEAKRVLGDDTWSFSLDELDALLGIMYVRGACAMKGLQLESLWSKDYGLNLAKAAMSQNRFKEILWFLRFDLKSNRSERLQTDKFAHISEVWNDFVSNCQSCYVPGPFLSVDEQLFPTKARCRFTQYIASKPDKFGQKFWMIVDKDYKYMLNAFPYLGKEDSRSENVRLWDYVVEKLSKPYLKKGRNITCDNFFMSANLAEKFLGKSTSMVGTVNKVRREVPQAVKNVILETFDTVLLKNKQITLTVYQEKPAKNVVLLSTLHPDVQIGSDKKKKTETVRFYNQTKFGVDIVDQMARKYSVKAKSRRWPMHTFYNLLDLAGINAWILYRKCTHEKISRRKYLLRLGEQLSEKRRNDRSRTEDIVDGPEPLISRRRCQIRANCGTDGKSVNKCSSCNQVTCKKCVGKTSYVCSVCTE